MRRGVIEEVAAVLAEGHAPTAPGLDGIGIREAVEYLHGRRPRESVADAIAVEHATVREAAGDVVPTSAGRRGGDAGRHQAAGEGGRGDCEAMGGGLRNALGFRNAEGAMPILTAHQLKRWPCGELAEAGGG